MSSAGSQIKTRLPYPAIALRNPGYVRKVSRHRSLMPGFEFPNLLKSELLQVIASGNAINRVIGIAAEWNLQIQKKR